jgi:putative RecB family exonuclease
VRESASTSAEITKDPLAGLVEWGGRNGTRLILAPDAVRRLTRKSLSPSTAAAMSGCQARWSIERLLPRATDPFGTAELGSAAHRVFELLFEQDPVLRDMSLGLRLVTSLQDDQNGGSISVPDNPGDLPRWHEEVSRRVMGLWAIEDPTKIDVIGNEVKVADVEVGGVPFFGYIDRIHRTADDVVISDYKAGKVHKPGRFGDPHGDQLRLYVAALSETGICETPTAAEVLYTTHRTRQAVDTTPGAIAKTTTQFAKAWELLEKGLSSSQFPTKTSALCGWCPAVTVCPAAQAKGLGPRTDSCTSGELLGIGTKTAKSAAGGSTIPPSHQSESNVPPASSDGVSGRSESTAMSSEPQEGKSWEPTLPDGRLNTNSFAATSVFGIVDLAVTELHKAGQPIKVRSVKALSQTFTQIIDTVHQEVRGRASFQSGLHTRLRGALRTTIETMPLPFGEDSAAWDSWVERATNRVRGIAKTAIAMWESDDEPTTERPWAVFAKPSLAVVEEEGS